MMTATRVNPPIRAQRRPVSVLWGTATAMAAEGPVALG